MYSKDDPWKYARLLHLISYQESYVQAIRFTENVTNVHENITNHIEIHIHVAEIHKF